MMSILFEYVNVYRYIGVSIQEGPMCVIDCSADAYVLPCSGTYGVGVQGNRYQ